MMERNERYADQLGFWLRAGGVKGDRVVSILSEVRTHLADSGEDPYEAFDTPRAYAKEFISGSGWSWDRRVAGALALVALALGCYSAGVEVANVRNQRPLWWSAPQWVVAIATLLLLLTGWRALLYFASRHSISFAAEDVDAQRASKKRVVGRRAISLGILAAVVVASGSWGTVLADAYVNSPRLRVTDFVYSSADQNAGADTDVYVRTVIYLDAPGPAISLNMAALSLREDPGGSVGSLLQGFNSLDQAINVAKDRNWGISGNQLPGFTLNYGSYYVLTWAGQIFSTYTSNPSKQEYLVITYLVTGAGLKTLRIPLAVNS